MILKQFQVFMPLVIIALSSFVFIEQVKGENVVGTVISPDVGGINSAEICNSFKLYQFGSNIINKLGTDCACYSTDSGYNITCQDKLSHCYNSACAKYNGQYQIEVQKDKVLLTYEKYCNSYNSGFDGNPQFCDVKDYTKNPDKFQVILNNEECADVRKEKCQVFNDGSYSVGYQIDCRNLGTQKIMNTCDMSSLEGTGVFHHYYSFDGKFTVKSSAHSTSIATSLLSVACFLSTLLFVF